MIDSEYLQKGKSYDELPDVHIIYISETDLWKAGKTTYPVKKYFEGTEISYDDGMHILHVNAAVEDGTDPSKCCKIGRVGSLIAHPCGAYIKSNNSAGS